MNIEPAGSWRLCLTFKLKLAAGSNSGCPGQGTMTRKLMKLKIVLTRSHAMNDNFFATDARAQAGQATSFGSRIIIVLDLLVLILTRNELELEDAC